MKHFLAGVCAVLGLAACSPALDWRQLRPEGLGIEVTFPCRPASHARRVQLAGQPVSMVLHACSIDGMTFGLASAELPDVRQVDAALMELADAAVRNLSATLDTEDAADVAGMTPSARARRVRLSGRLPDGRSVVEHAAFFARGARVYQATLLGNGLPPEAVEVFFGGLKVRP